MDEIHFSKLTDVGGIEVLRGRSGRYNDFVYTYERPTLDLLKKNFFLRDSLYLVADNGTVFVAFCSIDRDWWENNFFMIREIIVDQNFQKQGIGETIMRMCIEHAQSKGAAGVVTETAFENIPMQKLCIKLGFKVWDNPQLKEGVTYKLLFQERHN